MTPEGTTYKQHIGFSRRTLDGVLINSYWYL